MKNSLAILTGLTLLLVLGLVLLPSAPKDSTLSGPPNRAAGGLGVVDSALSPVDGVEVFVSEPSVPTISVAVRDLPPYDPGLPFLDREMAARDDWGFMGPDIQGSPWDNPLVVIQANAPRAALDDGFNTPVLNFAGVQSGSSPPDDTGDVGPNHFLQGDNGPGGSRVTVYNKSGVQLAQFNMESLATTAPCNNGYCDPIIQYDELADRWLITEFDTTIQNLCVYVSTSPDPLGTWYVYSFNPAGGSQDYPKYAIWPDGYYVGVNNGGYVHVLDRVSMLAGAPATSQSFDIGTLPGFGFQLSLPATMEGPPPPAGEPAIFMRPVDTEVHSGYSCSPEPCDLMELWALHVDWNSPGNSSLTPLPDVRIAEFDHTLCGTGSDWSCMPQPGTSQKLDPIREPIHFPLQYRNFGDYETLVGCFAEDVDGTDHAVVHWFEIRRTSGLWSLYQEGVLGGEPNVHRSVCSAAMDKAGNIAVGYTRTGDYAPYYPSIYYSGRRASDPLGTMPNYDNLIWDATSSKSNNERWGDYSGIGVDPSDGCTFWFTTEYGGYGNTRIAAFRFDGCLQDFNLSASPSELEVSRTGTAQFDISVGESGGFTETVNLSVDSIPADTEAAFVPAGGTPPFTSVMIITTTGTTPLGDHLLTVIGDAGTGNTHTDQVTLTVVAPPELTVVKSAAPEVNTGTLLQYTLQVSNSGGPATGLVISDSIPANTAFAWAAEDGHLVGDQVVWQDLTLSTGAVLSVTYGVAVSCVPSGTELLNDEFAVHATEAPWLSWGDPVRVNAVTEAVSVDFSHPGQVLTGEPTVFGNLSMNATDYLWDFGDGATSSERDPVHEYNDTGKFTVILTATNVCQPEISASHPLWVDNYAVQISPASAFDHGAPGDTILYSLWVTNTGTLSDSFEVTIQDADWPTESSNDLVSLDAGEVTGLEITVFVPTNALGGELDTSVIKIESLSDPRRSTAAAEAELTTVADTTFGVTLAPLESYANAGPGDTVTYTLQVVNTSNSVDTIYFSRANAGWPTSFSEDSKVIARFGIRSVEVYVTVPEDTEPGEHDLALIEAIGSGGEAVRVSLSTAVRGHLLYLPMLLR